MTPPASLLHRIHWDHQESTLTDLEKAWVVRGDGGDLFWFSGLLLTSSSILLDSSLLLRVPHDLEQNPLAVVQENSQIPAGASSAQEDPLGLGMPKHSSVTTNFPSTGLVPLDLKQGEGRRWRLQCLALARFPLSLGDGSRPRRWPPPASRRPRAPLWASCSVLRWCAP